MRPKDNNPNNESTTNKQANEPSIQYLEKIVLNACLDAGKYIRENAFNALELKWKKIDDPVTILDKNAEQQIRKQIGDVVHANFYGEEYGINNQGADINIYIDPIDGTKSFARGEFLSSVSVAADYKEEMFIGVVYDFMRDIIYYATNDGAFVKTSYTKQDKRLPAYNIKLSKPSISFGNMDDKYTHLLQNNLPKGMHAEKQMASVALSMAQLAAGSYDGMIMSPYTKEGITDTCDIAAGYYIMKQTGLEIRDYEMNEYNYRNPSKGIVAWNKEIDLGKIIEKYNQSQKVFV